MSPRNPNGFDRYFEDEDKRAVSAPAAAPPTRPGIDTRFERMDWPPPGPGSQMPVLVPDQPTGMQDQPPPGELQQVWNRLRETPIGLGIRSAFYGDQDAQYKLGVLNAQPRSYGAAAAMSPEMSFYEGMREAPGVTLGGATLGVLPTAAGARALTATPGVALAAPRGAMRYWRYLDKQYPYVMRPLGMGIGAAVGPYVPQWLHSLWHGLSHE